MPGEVLLRLWHIHTSGESYHVGGVNWRRFNPTWFLGWKGIVMHSEILETQISAVSTFPDVRARMNKLISRFFLPCRHQNVVKPPGKYSYSEKRRIHVLSIKKHIQWIPKCEHFTSHNDKMALPSRSQNGNCSYRNARMFLLHPMTPLVQE